MQNFSTSPRGMAESFWRNRALIRVLVVREVAGRYRGSIMGIFWSFFNPVFMLAVYTFVFSFVFKVRWGGVGEEPKTVFALTLFAGLLIFNLFAECIAKAPFLILHNPTYVKKVVFPLDMLPWVSFGAALFHCMISFAVWLLFYVVIVGLPPATSLLFPLILIPLMLLTMGLSWFLASLGVYFRDIGQVIGIIITALMFLTPIFYPIIAIPEHYRVMISLNPLTHIVEQARDLLIFGRGMAWGAFGVTTAGAGMIAWLGYAWFQKTRKGFADVL